MSQDAKVATGASPEERKRSPVRKLYDWVLHWADTPYGTPALGALSFAESSFFPIPPDPLLVALAVAKPRRAFWYAGVCSVSSVLGGIAGYAIGHFVWLRVQGFFFSYVFSQELFDKVAELYHTNAFLAVLTAGFTPIPYKVFTVSAGVVGILLPTFILASAIGRSARFLLVAGIIWKFGPAIKERLEAHFDAFALGFTALLILGFVVIKWLL